MAVADNNDNGKSQPTVEFLTALFQHTEATDLPADAGQ